MKDLASPKAAQRVSGRALSVAAAIASSAAGAKVANWTARGQFGVRALEQLPESARAALPLHNHPRGARPPRESELDPRPLPSPWRDGVRALGERFAKGEHSPSAELEQVLAGRERMRLDRTEPMLEWCVDRAQALAAESSARHREGRARGALDGVPFVIKEQLAVRGLRRPAGARVLDDQAPMEVDAHCVDRLIDAGAVPLGTTVMTEFGMTPSGANPHRAMPRNPHDGRALAGGSSTGSGVAVATGMVPLAIGVDGGGSVRIPAARNGVFGLKPTFGRISRSGDVAGGSVAHVGPLARDSFDLACMLQAMSAPDAADEDTLQAPAALPDFAAATQRGVRGLSIGLCVEEIADAEPEVQAAVERARRALERSGATVHEVRAPLLRHAPAVGFVTIAAETLASVGALYARAPEKFGADLRLSFAALSGFSALELLDAARLREALRRQMQEQFVRHDLLLLPSTVRAADHASTEEFASGFSDPELVTKLCRFMFLANLTGLPALNAPCGLDRQSMPLGVQLIGDAWDEATVLAASAALEREGVARSERPLLALP